MPKQKSVNELHKQYKAKGGKKSFADFRKAYVAKTKPNVKAATKVINRRKRQGQRKFST